MEMTLTWKRFFNVRFMDVKDQDMFFKSAECVNKNILENPS